METIFLPSKMHIAAGDAPNMATLTIEPLHHGYGTTVGNALRRVLLSSLPGAAVTAVKIKGVQHEFQAVTGVKEDVLDIILALKQLRMKVHADEAVTLKLTKKGEGPVTAADIEKNADVEIANPDLVLATITTASTTLDMEITVSRGRGFLPTEEREDTSSDIGVMAIDALFSPVRQVSLKVENTRVGDITNYDKLIMNIETDGTLAPSDALEQATKILINHFTWMQGQLSHASLTEQIVRAKEEAPKNDE
ncbi:DNA-directed RNA polymerase subunit alpha [bacterium]|jgi:DNA-directed RNA polymerase subunit alpha|nr:DNA-directed RNA polymerase subunit alpha [bacterium]